MRQTMIKVGEGSFDHADPVAQMQAVDLALSYYFKTPDWLVARDRQPKVKPRSG